jgi:hypothetical protein
MATMRPISKDSPLGRIRQMRLALKTLNGDGFREDQTNASDN